VARTRGIENGFYFGNKLIMKPPAVSSMGLFVSIDPFSNRRRDDSWKSIVLKDATSHSDV
jgi:hypothetical protein